MPLLPSPFFLSSSFFVGKVKENVFPGFFCLKFLLKFQFLAGTVALFSSFWSNFPSSSLTSFFFFQLRLRFSVHHVKFFSNPHNSESRFQKFLSNFLATCLVFCPKNQWKSLFLLVEMNPFLNLQNLLLGFFPENQTKLLIFHF